MERFFGACYKQVLTYVIACLFIENGLKKDFNEQIVDESKICIVKCLNYCGNLADIIYEKDVSCQRFSENGGKNFVSGFDANAE